MKCKRTPREDPPTTPEPKPRKEFLTKKYAYILDTDSIEEGRLEYIKIKLE